MLIVVEGAGKEPIGNRMIESPKISNALNCATPHPASSLTFPRAVSKRERNLSWTGGNKTIRCTICHGPDLKGMGSVPPLAGRSPSQMTRADHDIQTGARNGPWAQVMKETVAQLTVDDIVNIVSYLASLQP